MSNANSRILSILAVHLGTLVFACIAFGASPVFAQHSISAHRPVRMMAFGDSITYGYAAPNVIGGYRSGISKLLPFPTVWVGSQKYGTGPFAANEGYPGWTTLMLTPIAVREARLYRPDIVCFMAGFNDICSHIYQRQSYSGILHSIGTIAHDIHASDPHAVIFIASLIPTRVRILGPPYQREFNALNAALPAYVRRLHRAGLPVVYVPMHETCGIDGFKDLAEGIHPNAGGEQKMAAVWAKSILARFGGGPPAQFRPD